MDNLSYYRMAQLWFIKPMLRKNLYGSRESIHCIPVKYEAAATFYKVYRGSHTYDTKEMSALIDGTVADAKELGIETATPNELMRMKQEWNL